MSSAQDYVTLEFPSLPENVGFARNATAIYASRLDFTLDEIDDIRMCVSEAVSNAVVHAYPGGPGLIRMHLAVEGDKLVVLIEDQGAGIADVDWAKQPSNTTAPEEHLGLGLYFISEFMDEFEIETQVGRGTRVRMAKKPSQAKQHEAASSRLV